MTEKTPQKQIPVASPEHVTETRDVSPTPNNNNNKDNTSPDEPIADMEIETANDNDAASIPDDDDNNEEANWNTIEFKKKHNIFINADNCLGDNILEKKNHLETVIDNSVHLLGISSRKYGEEM